MPTSKQGSGRQGHTGPTVWLMSVSQSGAFLLILPP